MKGENAPTLSRLFPWRGSPRSTGHPGGLCPSRTRTRYINIFPISIFVVWFLLLQHTCMIEAIFSLRFFSYGIVFDTTFVLCRCIQIHMFILKIDRNHPTFLNMLIIFFLNEPIACALHLVFFFKHITTFCKIK